MCSRNTVQTSCKGNENVILKAPTLTFSIHVGPWLLREHFRSQRRMSKHVGYLPHVKLVCLAQAKSHSSVA